MSEMKNILVLAPFFIPDTKVGTAYTGLFDPWLGCQTYDLCWFFGNTEFADEFGLGDELLQHLEDHFKVTTLEIS